MNRPRFQRWVRTGAVGLMLAVFVVPIALSGPAGASLGTPPAQNDKVPTSIGKGEGKLNIIAWEGYTQPEWVKPFEQTTGCEVNVKYAGSSSEMVSLMANGGGHQWDLVSASGDADLRLAVGALAARLGLELLQLFHQFADQRFQSLDPSGSLIGGWWG